MSGTENIHHAQLWRLRDHFSRDGAIDGDEHSLLAAQEAICLATEAAHGLLYRGAVPRRVRRIRPELAAAISATIADIA